jgi:hypothetical protein
VRQACDVPRTNERGLSPFNAPVNLLRSSLPPATSPSTSSRSRGCRRSVAEDVFADEPALASVHEGADLYTYSNARVANNWRSAAAQAGGDPRHIPKEHQRNRIVG